MKHFIYISSIFLLFLAGCGTTQNVQESSTTFIPANNITYDQFYTGLSPYGRWVNYPGYGNVWIPMEQGFTPYSTNGHWQYTQLGWAWQSGYQWGWAPFHYGRWFRDPNYGWAWSPGYEWAPAWVDWRSGGDYYGWAPMSPNGFNQNDYYNNWTFIPRRYITERNIDRYYVPQQQNRQIINNTTINNNNVGKRSFNSGPPAKEVEAVINTKLRPAPISQPDPNSIRTRFPANHDRVEAKEINKPVIPVNNNPSVKNDPSIEERRAFHVNPPQQDPRLDRIQRNDQENKPSPVIVQKVLITPAPANNQVIKNSPSQPQMQRPVRTFDRQIMQDPSMKRNPVYAPPATSGTKKKPGNP